MKLIKLTQLEVNPALIKYVVESVVRLLGKEEGKPGRQVFTEGVKIGDIDDEAAAFVIDHGLDLILVNLIIIKSNKIISLHVKL